MTLNRSQLAPVTRENSIAPVLFTEAELWDSPPRRDNLEWIALEWLRTRRREPSHSDSKHMIAIIVR